MMYVQSLKSNFIYTKYNNLGMGKGSSLAVVLSNFKGEV